jgi:hypothetical protein
MTLIYHIFLDAIEIKLWFIRKKGNSFSRSYGVELTWTVEVHVCITYWRSPELLLVISCKKETESSRWDIVRPQSPPRSERGIETTDLKWCFLFHWSCLYSLISQVPSTDMSRLLQATWAGVVTLHLCKEIQGIRTFALVEGRLLFNRGGPTVLN